MSGMSVKTSWVNMVSANATVQAPALRVSVICCLLMVRWERFGACKLGPRRTPPVPARVGDGTPSRVGVESGAGSVALDGEATPERHPRRCGLGRGPGRLSGGVGTG